jgi:ferric-dicitrate binding protein FerR (iron transport regulator)
MLAGALAFAAWFGVRSRRDVDVSGVARSYHTDAGQRATVVLADGSRVVLAPQTTLSVGAGFGRDTREVFVRGEAYFDVTTSARAPFLVHTGPITTRVLGTSFDVKRYPDDAHVRVVVRSGKVVVRSARASLLLSAGMVGRITDSGGVASKVGDASQYAGWTTGGLRFVNIPVPDMLRQLGQWYGVTFKLSDSTLAHRDITITYEHVTAEQAISMLERVLNVKASYDATPGTGAASRIVTLTPGRGTASRKRNGSSVFSPSHEVGK